VTEGAVPADELKGVARVAALCSFVLVRTATNHRSQQTIRVVYAFGVTSNFCAQRACGVTIIARTIDATDRIVVEPFYFERTGAWAIVRTGTVNSLNCDI